MKKRIAAVTMAYNEKYKLPRWIRHYAAQVNGPRNCFIVDHGTDDGSTENIGPVNILRLPREAGAGSQTWRADMISKFCSSLLEEYDYVLYCDADELIVADPSRFRTLYEYVSVTPSPSTGTIGFDVLHDAASEPDLDDRFIFEQRSRLQFVASMCKPVLATQPVSWIKGFHCASFKPVFGDLYLFHLRYADLREGLDRLKITSSLARPENVNVAVDHWKITPDTYVGWVASWSKMPVVQEAIGPDNNEIRDYIRSFTFNQDNEGIYRFDYSMRSQVLFKADDRFRYAV